MEYYSPRRMKFPSKWVVLENLILRAVTQSEKDKKKGTEKKKGHEFRNASLSEIFLYKYRELLSECQATKDMKSVLSLYKSI